MCQPLVADLIGVAYYRRYSTRIPMNKKILVLASLVCAVCSSAPAQSDAHAGKADLNDLKPSEIITPIFSEILVIPFPQGFVPAFEHTRNDFYINEMVLKGETADHWTQMLTQTGAKGLSANPKASPEGYISSIAGGFKRTCPDTFSAKGIGTTTVSGHTGFVAYASCGTVNSSGYAHSESTLFICIKGTDDYYTVQWAERGPASSQPLAYDDAKWTERLKQLSPLKVFPRLPAPTTPQPSPADRQSPKSPPQK
jgi:hypothetical protein